MTSRGRGWKGSCFAGVNKLLCVSVQRLPPKPPLQKLLGPFDPRMACEVCVMHPLGNPLTHCSRNEEPFRGTGTGPRLVSQGSFN